MENGLLGVIVPLTAMAFVLLWHSTRHAQEIKELKERIKILEDLEGLSHE